MSLLALLLVLSAPKCEDRCAAAVKPCVQQCEKNFPKDQADQCRKACQGSVPGCLEQCKTTKESDK